jgi:hypothetical protein
VIVDERELINSSFTSTHITATTVWKCADKGTGLNKEIVRVPGFRQNQPEGERTANHCQVDEFNMPEGDHKHVTAQ